MKNTLAAISLAIFSISAFAQIPKGTSIIGGSFSGSYQSVESGDRDKTITNSLSFQPGYGLFVTNNLCIGIDLNFSLSHTSLEPADPIFEGRDFDTDERSFDTGPFIRYYVPISDKFYAFAAAHYSWGWGKTSTDYYAYLDDLIIDNITYNSTIRSFGLGTGLSYFINPHTAVELSLGYSHDKSKYKYSEGLGESTDKTNMLWLGIGFRIFLRRN